MRRWLLLAAGIALFVWLAWRYRHDLGVLRGVGVWDITVLVLLNMGGRLVVSEGVRLQLRALGYRLSTLEAFSTMLAAAYGNMFFPYGGVVPPAAYLQKRHGMPLTTLAASGAILAVLQVACLMLLGLAMLPLLPDGNVRWWLAMGFAGCLAGLATAVTWLSCRLWPVETIARRSVLVRAFCEAWRMTFAQGLRVPLGCLALQTVGILIRVYRLYWCYLAIGVSVGLGQIVIVTLLGDMAVLTSITPNGLGFREAVMSYTGQLLGVGAAATAASVMLDRIVLSIVIAISAQPAMGYLLGRTRRVQAVKAI